MNNFSMTFVKFVLVAFLLLHVFLTGCSGTGKPYISAARLTALEHNNRGIEAEARGSRELAHSEFSTALQLSSSIDDTDGTIVALLNLSRLSRRLNTLPIAESYLRRAQSKTADAQGRIGDVAVEETLLLLAQGETVSAKNSALRAVEHSTAANRASCYNLLARVDHLLGDAVGAEHNARRALGALTGEADRVEAANAYRLLGELAMAAGRNETAAQSFKEALTRDKEAGLSPRIASDLRFLARLAKASGNLPEAINYLHRAFEVSLNGGNNKAALEDLSSMIEICQLSGDTAQAVALESQRQKLLGEDSDAVSR